MNGFKNVCIGVAAVLVAGCVVYLAMLVPVYNRYQAIKVGTNVVVFDKVRGKVFIGSNNYLERHGGFLAKYGKDIYGDGIK